MLLNSIFKSSFFYPLLGLILLYFIICLVLYFKQEKIIFYPTLLADDYKFSEYQGFEEYNFDMPNGNRIHALYFKVDQPKGIVLYFHGNAGSLEKWGYAAQDFTRRNYAVLMPDYPTYGKSKGTLKEAYFYQDAAYLYTHLQEKYPHTAILVYGRSLGTGIACELASKKNPSQLILETPYFNFIEMGKEKLGFLPVKYLLKYHFRSDLSIKEVQCPIHIFHGTNDELIPYKQALRLAALSIQKNILTTIQGGGHNDLGRFEAFQKGLDLLLE